MTDRTALSTLHPNRMSLGRAGKSTNPIKTRSSMSRQSLAPSRQSLAPQQSRAQSANQSTNQSLSRRSSIHGRASSIHGQLTVSSIKSDSRPISDKSFQKESIAKIVLYCAAHSYDKNLTPKSLTGPSAKDFKSLCLFLFRRIDPGFDWSQSINQNQSINQSIVLSPEEDIKKFLKWIGYPFNVSKNALQAAGTPHTWPALLAMLSWLIDLLSYCDAVQAEEEESADIMQLDPAKPEKMFFEYVNQSYEMYMSGNDPSRADDLLHKSFAIRNQSINQSIEACQIEQAKLSAQLLSFQSAESEVAALAEKKTAYTEDIVKFQCLLSEVIAHREAIDRKLSDKTCEYQSINTKKCEMENSKEKLLDLISAQSLTPTQVTALNHQFSMLSSALIDFESKKTKIEVDRFHSEAAEQQSINELHESVAQFNANQAIVTEIDTEITLQIHRQAQTGILSIEPDLKTHVKTQLQSINQYFTSKLVQLTRTVTTSRDECRQLIDCLAESERAHREMQVSLTRREEAYQCQRHSMNTELSSLVNQVEGIEAQISNQINQSINSQTEWEHAKRQLQQLIADKTRIMNDLSADRSRSQSEAFSLIEACMQHQTEIKNKINQLNQTAEQIKSAIYQANNQSINQSI